MQNNNTPKLNIKSIKLSVDDYLEIEKSLDFACYILSIDAPLDWEDANEMHRRLCNAANLLTSNRRQIETALNFEFPEVIL